MQGLWTRKTLRHHTPLRAEVYNSTIKRALKNLSPTLRGRRRDLVRDIFRRLDSMDAGRVSQALTGRLES